MKKIMKNIIAIASILALASCGKDTALIQQPVIPADTFALVISLHINSDYDYKFGKKHYDGHISSSTMYGQHNYDYYRAFHYTIYSGDSIFFVASLSDTSDHGTGLAQQFIGNIQVDYTFIDSDTAYGNLSMGYKVE